MVVDSSALLAIMFLEPEAQRFTALIQASQAPLRGIANRDLFDAFVAESGMRLQPVTHGQVLLARDAYRRFGKGNHPAGLNFGDCFAYALAKERDVPLLFKGDDFALTDVRPAP